MTEAQDVTITAYSPTGSPIQGTVEIAEGVSYTHFFIDKKTGKPSWGYTGTTDGFYDSQETRMCDDEALFEDSNGDQWKESELVYIPDDMSEAERDFVLFLLRNFRDVPRASAGPPLVSRYSEGRMYGSVNLDGKFYQLIAFRVRNTSAESTSKDTTQCAWSDTILDEEWYNELVNAFGISSFQTQEFGGEEWVVFGAPGM